MSFMCFVSIAFVFFFSLLFFFLTTTKCSFFEVLSFVAFTASPVHNILKLTNNV